MNALIANPFQFGNPVEGEYYLDRPELCKTLIQFLGNRSHVVLIGPRRFGKTSFVLNLLKTFEEQSYVSVFVDVFNITSLRDFLQQMLAKYEIGSGAALSSALKALKEKGVLDEKETYRGSVVFDDPLFAFWLRDALK